MALSLPSWLAVRSKPKRTSLDIASRVPRGHDDHRIFKVDYLTVSVRDVCPSSRIWSSTLSTSGVGLLNFIKENDRVRFAADLLRKLSRIVIAYYISRWRTDDTGDRMLFHKLAHIQPNEDSGEVE